MFLRVRWVSNWLCRIFCGMAEHIKIDDLPSRVTYAVTSATSGPFAVPFAFFDDADLVVYNGLDELTFATDYTVTGAGVTPEPGVSGTVTLLAPASDTTISIIRDVAIRRTSDFPSSGPLPIKTLNTELDKQIAISQQLRDEIRVLAQADIEEQLQEVRDLAEGVEEIAEGIADFDAGLYLSKAENLAGLANPDAARENLGAGKESDGVPVGATFWFPVSAPPSGYLVANGAAVTSANPALRALLIADGSPHGTDGSNPRLPNLMTDGGRFIRSHDPASGRAFGSFQEDMVGPHDHSLARGGGNQGILQGSPGENAATSAANLSPGTTGQNSGTETRPKNISLLPCIKAG